MTKAVAPGPGYLALTMPADPRCRIVAPAAGHENGVDMSATIIDLAAVRRERAQAERQRRVDAFDRELRRRLALYLEGETIPVEQIKDNPYF